MSEGQDQGLKRGDYVPAEGRHGYVLEYVAGSPFVKCVNNDGEFYVSTSTWKVIDPPAGASTATPAPAKAPKSSVDAVRDKREAGE